MMQRGAVFVALCLLAWELRLSYGIAVTSSLPIFETTVTINKSGTNVTDVQTTNQQQNTIRIIGNSEDSVTLTGITFSTTPGDPNTVEEFDVRLAVSYVVDTPIVTFVRPFADIFIVESCSLSENFDEAVRIELQATTQPVVLSSMRRTARRRALQKHRRISKWNFGDKEKGTLFLNAYDRIFSRRRRSLLNENGSNQNEVDLVNINSILGEDTLNGYGANCSDATVVGNEVATDGGCAFGGDIGFGTAEIRENQEMVNAIQDDINNLNRNANATVNQVDEGIAMVDNEISRVSSEQQILSEANTQQFTNDINTNRFLQQVNGNLQSLALNVQRSNLLSRQNAIAFNNLVDGVSGALAAQTARDNRLVTFFSRATGDISSYVNNIISAVTTKIYADMIIMGKQLQQNDRLTAVDTRFLLDDLMSKISGYLETILNRADYQAARQRATEELLSSLISVTKEIRDNVFNLDTTPFDMFLAEEMIRTVGLFPFVIENGVPPRRLDQLTSIGGTQNVQSYLDISQCSLNGADSPGVIQGAKNRMDTFYREVVRVNLRIPVEENPFYLRFIRNTGSPTFNYFMVMELVVVNATEAYYYVLDHNTGSCGGVNIPVPTVMNSESATSVAYCLRAMAPDDMSPPGAPGDPSVPPPRSVYPVIQNSPPYTNIELAPVLAVKLINQPPVRFAERIQDLIPEITDGEIANAELNMRDGDIGYMLATLGTTDQRLMTLVDTTITVPQCGGISVDVPSFFERGGPLRTDFPGAYIRYSQAGLENEVDGPLEQIASMTMTSGRNVGQSGYVPNEFREVDLACGPMDTLRQTFYMVNYEKFVDMRLADFQFTDQALIGQNGEVLTGLPDEGRRRQAERRARSPHYGVQNPRAAIKKVNRRDLKVTDFPKIRGTVPRKEDVERKREAVEHNAYSSADIVEMRRHRYGATLNDCYDTPPPGWPGPGTLYSPIFTEPTRDGPSPGSHMAECLAKPGCMTIEYRRPEAAYIYSDNNFGGTAGEIITEFAVSGTPLKKPSQGRSIVVPYNQSLYLGASRLGCDGLKVRCEYEICSDSMCIFTDAKTGRSTQEDYEQVCQLYMNTQNNRNLGFPGDKWIPLINTMAAANTAHICGATNSNGAFIFEGSRLQEIKGCCVQYAVEEVEGGPVADLPYAETIACRRFPTASEQSIFVNPQQITTRTALESVCGECPAGTEVDGQGFCVDPPNIIINPSDPFTPYSARNLNADDGYQVVCGTDCEPRWTFCVPDDPGIVAGNVRRMDIPFFERDMAGFQSPVDVSGPIRYSYENGIVIDTFRRCESITTRAECRNDKYFDFCEWRYDALSSTLSDSRFACFDRDIPDPCQAVNSLAIPNAEKRDVCVHDIVASNNLTECVWQYPDPLRSEQQRIDPGIFGVGTCIRNPENIDLNLSQDGNYADSCQRRNPDLGDSCVTDGMCFVFYNYDASVRTCQRAAPFQTSATASLVYPPGAQGFGIGPFDTSFDESCSQLDFHCEYFEEAATVYYYARLQDGGTFTLNRCADFATGYRQQCGFKLLSPLTPFVGTSGYGSYESKCQGLGLDPFCIQACPTYQRDMNGCLENDYCLFVGGIPPSAADFNRMSSTNVENVLAATGFPTTAALANNIREKAMTCQYDFDPVQGIDIGTDMWCPTLTEQSIYSNCIRPQNRCNVLSLYIPGNTVVNYPALPIRYTPGGPEPDPPDLDEDPFDGVPFPPPMGDYLDQAACYRYGGEDLTPYVNYYAAPGTNGEAEVVCLSGLELDRTTQFQICNITIPSLRGTCNIFVYDVLNNPDDPLRSGTAARDPRGAACTERARYQISRDITGCSGTQSYPDRFVDPSLNDVRVNCAAFMVPCNNDLCESGNTRFDQYIDEQTRDRCIADTEEECVNIFDALTENTCAWVRGPGGASVCLEQNSQLVRFLEDNPSATKVDFFRYSTEQRIEAWFVTASLQDVQDTLYITPAIIEDPDNRIVIFPTPPPCPSDIVLTEHLLFDIPYGDYTNFIPFADNFLCCNNTDSALDCGDQRIRNPTHPQNQFNVQLVEECKFRIDSSPALRAQLGITTPTISRANLIALLEKETTYNTVFACEVQPNPVQEQLGQFDDPLIVSFGLENDQLYGCRPFLGGNAAPILPFTWGPDLTAVPILMLNETIELVSLQDEDLLWREPLSFNRYVYFGETPSTSVEYEISPTLNLTIFDIENLNQEELLFTELNFTVSYEETFEVGNGAALARVIQERSSFEGQNVQVWGVRSNEGVVTESRERVIIRGKQYNKCTRASMVYHTNDTLAIRQVLNLRTECSAVISKGQQLLSTPVACIVSDPYTATLPEMGSYIAHGRFSLPSGDVVINVPPEFISLGGSESSRCGAVTYIHSRGPDISGMDPENYLPNTRLFNPDCATTTAGRFSSPVNTGLPEGEYDWCGLGSVSRTEEPPLFFILNYDFLNPFQRAFWDQQIGLFDADYIEAFVQLLRSLWTQVGCTATLRNFVQPASTFDQFRTWWELSVKNVTMGTSNDTVEILPGQYIDVERVVDSMQTWFNARNRIQCGNCGFDNSLAGSTCDPSYGVIQNIETTGTRLDANTAQGGLCLTNKFYWFNNTLPTDGLRFRPRLGAVVEAVFTTDQFDQIGISLTRGFCPVVVDYFCDARFGTPCTLLLYNPLLVAMSFDIRIRGDQESLDTPSALINEYFDTLCRNDVQRFLAPNETDVFSISACPGAFFIQVATSDGVMCDPILNGTLVYEPTFAQLTPAQVNIVLQDSIRAASAELEARLDNLGEIVFGDFQNEVNLELIQFNNSILQFEQDVDERLLEEQARVNAEIANQTLVIVDLESKVISVNTSLDEFKVDTDIRFQDAQDEIDETIDMIEKTDQGLRDLSNNVTEQDQKFTENIDELQKGQAGQNESIERAVNISEASFTVVDDPAAFYLTGSGQASYWWQVILTIIVTLVLLMAIAAIVMGSIAISYIRSLKKLKVKENFPDILEKYQEELLPQNSAPPPNQPPPQQYFPSEMYQRQQPSIAMGPYGRGMGSMYGDPRYY